MIQPYKDRSINPEKLVYVYRNLHKEGRWYSLKQNGKVVAHADCVHLNLCLFKVYEKGRQRVLREKQKNVHAYIIGYFVPEAVYTYETAVSYDPYKYPHFYTIGENKAVSTAYGVVLDDRGVHAYRVI
jgi:hypothetical protein